MSLKFPGENWRWLRLKPALATKKDGKTFIADIRGASYSLVALWTVYNSISTTSQDFTKLPFTWTLDWKGMWKLPERGIVNTWKTGRRQRLEEQKTGKERHSRRTWMKCRRRSHWEHHWYYDQQCRWRSTEGREKTWLFSTLKVKCFQKESFREDRRK